MIGRAVGLWIGLAATLAGCSRPAPDVAATPVSPAKAAGPVAAPPAVAPVAPEGAEAVDAALKAAQAYDAALAAELAGIDVTEKRIHALAERAAAAAARGEARSVTAAKADADKARNGLADGLAALRTSAPAQTAAIDAALAQCAATPELTTSEACVALAAEQTTLTAAIEALTNRYQAAESAFVADRAKLDEAAATVALGSLR